MHRADPQRLHALDAVRGFALLLFFVQLIANFAWSPLFFGQHQVTTALYLIIFIPTACLLFPAEQAGFALLTEFAASKGLGFIALAGGLGAIAYRCWYISMTLTGVSRAMALNITYALWGILLSALFTDVEITQTLVVGAVTIFAGMFLVIGNPKDMFTLRQGD